MNTKPVFELHPGLDHLDPQKKNTLNTYSAGIDELVSFGTHVLSWGLEATNGRDEVIPQLMIFRNILENLDAISVLVRAGSIDPCKSLLRVVLESVLNLEFMLQGAVERNGLAFLICNYHSENKLTSLNNFAANSGQTGHCPMTSCHHTSKAYMPTGKT
jgi:hypothetical protein